MTTDKILIAIVDDDADDREIFIRAANHLDLGIRTIEFENGLQLIEFLNESLEASPHIIFLDLNNPFMDGLECLQIIRQIDKCLGTLIAIYSSSALRKDIDGTFVLGADIYIQKPHSLEELQKYIVEAVRIHSQYPEKNFSRADYFIKI